jgi:hypothetical protein
LNLKIFVISFRFNTISEQGLNLSSVGWLALIYPAGFLMGQPFPRGLKLQCMQPAGD